MVDPLQVLKQAIRAVPAVRYALGIAGVAAVIAIVKLFGLNPTVAALGTVVVLFLMAALVVFANLSALGAGDFRLPALVFTWSALILLIACAILLFTSTFFGKPLQLVPTSSPSASDATAASPAVTANVPDYRSDEEKTFERIKGKWFSHQANSKVKLCGAEPTIANLQLSFDSFDKHPGLPVVWPIVNARMWVQYQCSPGVAPALTSEGTIMFVLNNGSISGKATITSCWKGQEKCPESALGEKNAELEVKILSVNQIKIQDWVFER